MDKESYVKVPGPWVDILQRATLVETWRLAMFILYRRWRFPKDETVTVNNVAMRSLGMTGQQKKNALAELETLGLVKIYGCDGIASAVELLV
jgi:hypothetical protein